MSDGLVEQRPSSGRLRTVQRYLKARQLHRWRWELLAHWRPADWLLQGLLLWNESGHWADLHVSRLNRLPNTRKWNLGPTVKECLNWLWVSKLCKTLTCGIIKKKQKPDDSVMKNSGSKTKKKSPLLVSFLLLFNILSKSTSHHSGLISDAPFHQNFGNKPPAISPRISLHVTAQTKIMLRCKEVNAEDSFTKNTAFKIRSAHSYVWWKGQK